jgi:Flp pilus assembly protein TadB
MSERKRPSPVAREQVAAAWAGVTLTVIVILGLLAAPGARLLWIVLLVFGIATIPQVLLWRRTARDKESRDKERT